MFKTLLAFCVAIPFSLPLAFATQHQVQIQGFSYSPSVVSAVVGDTVVISGDFGSHPTVEVSEATWNADGSARLTGGFGSTSGNQFSVVLTTPGNRYYVCRPHVSLGMKGMLMVAPTSIKLSLAVDMLYPNPATNQVMLPGLQTGNATIVNANGQTVRNYMLKPGQEQMNVSDLPNGTYLLQAANRVYRFVKE